MELPIDHRDVTTIMGLLGDIHVDVRSIRSRTRMEQRKHRKLTAEDIARHEEHKRWVRERIAYHEAKAREEDERRARCRP